MHLHSIYLFMNHAHLLHTLNISCAYCARQLLFGGIDLDKEQKKQLGQKLRALREKTGMYQSDVAERVGVDRASVSNYEIGRAMPTGKTLGALADLFHTTTDYLLGKTENSDPIDGETEFLSDLDLSNEELFERYNFKFDGVEITEEEAKGIIAFLRASRQMK